MSDNLWQLQQPLDAILFDCDSTLSAIEGITVLAKHNGVFQEVYDLTERAMAETGVNLQMYQERLNLVKPELWQMEQVVQAYWENLTPDVDQVIQVLQSLQKSVYVVSAGLQQAVEPFAAKLNIPGRHVFAVNIYFDERGHYQSFDRESPLAFQYGKSLIVEELRDRYSRIAHIGDGMNDVEAAKVVDRFIGYGGSIYRESIAKMSPFYICSLSMAPLLPLLLTKDEVLELKGESLMLYKKGYDQLCSGMVEIRN